MSSSSMRGSSLFRADLRTVGARAASSSFVRSVAGTLLTRVVAIGAGLATSVIVARTLGPTGRGTFAVAMALTAIGVQFGNLGLHSSNTYAAARNRELLPVLTANSLYVALALGSLVAGVVFVLRLVAPDLVPLRDAELIVTLVAIPVGLGALLLQNLLLGVHDVAAFNRTELVTRGAVLALSAGVIVAGAVSVTAMLAVSAAAVLLGAAASLAWLRPHLGGHLRPSLAVLRSYLGFGLRSYWAALFSFLVLRADLLMVQSYLGETDAGYYSVAVTLADMLYMVPVVIGTVLFPRLVGTGDALVRHRTALRISAAVAVLMLGVVAAGMLAAPLLVNVLYGADFEPAVAAFVWLAPGIGALGVHTVLMNYCASLGMPRIAVMLPLAGLLVNLALNALLLPRMGLTGASLASVIAYTAMAAGALALVLTFPLAQPAGAPSTITQGLEARES